MPVSSSSVKSPIQLDVGESKLFNIVFNWSSEIEDSTEVQKILLFLKFELNSSKLNLNCYFRF